MRLAAIQIRAVLAPPLGGRRESTIDPLARMGVARGSKLLPGNVATNFGCISIIFLESSDDKP